MGVKTRSIDLSIYGCHFNWVWYENLKKEWGNISRRWSNWKKPRWSNIGTYKEICYLTSDLNRLGLIYLTITRFETPDTLQHLVLVVKLNFPVINFTLILQLLYPNLYQFNPNPKIQQWMNVIWSSLITKTIKNIYFILI